MYYSKIQCYRGSKSFPSLSNIILFFPLYVRRSLTILKFLQDILKIALFSLSFNKGFFNKGFFDKGFFNKGFYNKGFFNKGFFNKGVFNKEFFNKGFFNKGFFDKGFFFIQKKKKIFRITFTSNNFSIFLKSTYLLFTVFLKFIFSQKGKGGLYGPKLSISYFESIQISFQKEICSLKIAVYDFQK